uniref:Uncharacterized protein n=1 Tax=Parascaris univalens TaxID=6257 RepID=A0A914ZKD1_PARUN
MAARCQYGYAWRTNGFSQRASKYSCMKFLRSRLVRRRRRGIQSISHRAKHIERLDVNTMTLMVALQSILCLLAFVTLILSSFLNEVLREVLLDPAFEYTNLVQWDRDDEYSIRKSFPPLLPLSIAFVEDNYLPKAR